MPGQRRSATGLAYAHDMNADDLREILRSVRNGKQYADFMIATIHTRDLNSSLVKAHHGEPPDLSSKHKAIDNGADAWVDMDALLRGIEILHDKPIFYGLASSSGRWTDDLTESSDGDMTEAELAARNWGHHRPPSITTQLTQSKFDKAGAEIGYSDRGATDPCQARDRRWPLAPRPRILERLQALSSR